MAEIDLLLKLFDTLKDQLKDIHTAFQALLTNQNNIGNYIRNLPMEEVRQLLKDHTKDSSDEIGTCKETVETKSDDILGAVDSMKERVDRMILIIKVAFALFGVAILIGGITYNYLGKHDQKVMEEQKQDEHKELKQELKEEFKKALEEFKKEQ